MDYQKPTVDPLYGSDETTEPQAIAFVIGPVAGAVAGAVLGVAAGAVAYTEVEVHADYLLKK